VSGWYHAPVSIAFAGADQVSGVDSCATVNYSGPDTGAASVPGTCRDKAGNVSAPLGFALKYDGTGPTVTSATPARAADANGWYNHAVAIAFAGADPISGVATCTNTTYSEGDSATASVTGTCTDKAGNPSSPLSFGFKYDETAPQVTSGVARRSPDTNGWYNQAVVFDFGGADATSGLAACPSVTYTGPDSATASVVGRCTDRAGNSANRPFDLKYDDTAPHIAGATPDRPPNAAGWYRQPVTLGFGGSDATSGVAPGACTTKTYDGPDSDAASVTGTCTDRAGNVSGTDTFALKYDATAPAVLPGAPGRPPDVNGWYNHAVSVDFDGTDAMSGVDGCTTLTYGGPDTGAASVTGTCGDRAGNVSGARDFALKYDETGPVVTDAQPDRQPDHAGWFVSPVRFDISGTDATSGVGGCPSVNYSGPDGADATIAGVCRDLAGNSTSRDFPLDYDATPPLLSLTAASGDGNVALSWQTSPDADSAVVMRTPGVGGEPTSAVFRGRETSFVDGLVENGGRYSYEVRVQDAAGNATTQTVIGLPAAPPAGGGPAQAVPGVLGVPVRVPVLPKPRTIEPAPGSVFTAGDTPLLQWPVVERARYYNVQLFRGKVKLLSAWPARPRYQLKMRWNFRHERRRLGPGRYRWMVWPGFGKRARAHYGKPIVRSTFVVRKAPAD
jgi:hypothetical protein